MRSKPSRLPLNTVAGAVSAILASSYAPTVALAQSGLEEIVVTARKREETLLSVPQRLK